MAKYISFSVWGDNPLYNIGMIKNINLAKEIYPDWQLVVYYNNTISTSLKDALMANDVLAIDMTKSKIFGEFWRFLAADLPNCTHAIFRDADSRLSNREKLAVEEWIKDNTVIHVMRDHPYHEVPFGASKMAIMAGMWGIKAGMFSMKNQIEAYLTHFEQNEYGRDQAFLQIIYEKLQDNITVHDEFYSNKPFPSPRIGYRFVGERIDVNEQPYGEDWKAIMQHYQNKQLYFKTKNFLKSVYFKLFK